MSFHKKIRRDSEKTLKSFKYGFDGIASAVRSERNMKIHIMIMILVIIAGFLLKITMGEWIACIILFGMVIAGELMNTAIELVVDIIMPYQHEKARRVKDIAAGSVLVSAIAAAVVGFIIFVPKIMALI